MEGIEKLQEFPDSPDAMSHTWLSKIIGGKITAMGWQPIGTGQVGDSFRLTVSLEGEDAPRTYAAKFAAADPTSRSTAAMFGLYAKEVAFYRDIAPSLAARTPQAHYTGVSADGTSCILLFEDLGPARQGDQVAGCSPADALAAIEQAALVHGSSWQRHDLLGADWLAPVSNLAEMLVPLYGQAHAVFRDRFASVLEPELMTVCEGLAQMAPQWFGRRIERTALVHGDFRLDNMLFDTKGGAEPIAILDWQTVSAGNPLTDIGYFMGCGIGEELRREHEASLLDAYRSAMGNFGANIQESDFRRGYSLGALHGVATAVFSAAHVERTERGDANFLSMARGACALARDAESLRALAELG